MKLSVYCGLRAIAYIITDGINVVKHGIKRVNISYENYYEFIAGLPVSKRISRRLKRQARRNLWRYKSRRERLQKLLMQEFNCKPTNRTRTANLLIRVKALTEIVTAQELVDIICQLQNKRGYKSLRGVSDNENSEYLKEIEQHQQKLQQYRSIAEYLLTTDSSKNIVFMRQSYEQEFNAIMDMQATFHLNLAQGEKLRERIYNLIYFQNPLKKGKVGKCCYERNREVCHASNPVYQEFRIWRDIHNIQILDIEKNEIEISFEQRKKWFDKCFAGTNITKASCLKDLGLKKPTQYSWYSGKVIAGNPIAKAFSELKIHEPELVLWQDLFSATDNDRLAKLLHRKYQFSDYQINELCDLELKKLGYADFSMKAIRKLLPHLQEGMKLKEAILHVYGKVDFESVALRNVVLEQHFASCKALIDVLQKEFDIDEVQFEIDHLLKQGNKGRKAIAQGKRKDEKFEKQHPKLSQYNRIKLQLWEESGGISPYEPDVIIDKKDLFSDKYNLDHVVPKSKLFERSYTNQVLCPRHLNEKKGRMTGIDFAKELNIEEQYRDAVSKFPENKQQYLLMSEDDIPDNWISRRQNSDYNTKCFATLFKGAVNIPNKLINRYTGQWLQNKYSEQDARYYLCKAWVMANMSADTVAYFDNIKNESGNIDSVSVYDIQPGLMEIDMDNYLVAMPKIKFSRKTNFGYSPRFALHQESIFGQRIRKSRNAKGEIVEELFYKIRQPVSKLTPPMVEKIMDKAIREKIQERIARKANHDDGIASLMEEPATHNGKPIHRVSVMQNAEKIYPLHSTDGKGNTAKFAAHERKIDFVFSDKNRFLKVWIDDKGKVKRETVTLMEWMNNLNQQLETTYEYPVMLLQENDIVELHGRYWFVIGASESMALRPVTTLSATDTYKVKVDDWKEMEKVIVNQLGQIISKQSLYGNSENTKRLQVGKRHTRKESIIVW